jgi:hypothetical protein
LKDVANLQLLKVFSDKQSSKVGIEPINSIRCQNMMIRKKIKGRSKYKEEFMDAEKLIQCPGHIPISNRLRNVSPSPLPTDSYLRALRDNMPSIELIK